VFSVVEVLHNDSELSTIRNSLQGMPSERVNFYYNHQMIDYKEVISLRIFFVSVFFQSRRSVLEMGRGGKLILIDENIHSST
jgi:hypothetical protein